LLCRQVSGPIKAWKPIVIRTETLPGNTDTWLKRRSNSHSEEDEAIAYCDADVAVFVGHQFTCTSLSM
jgi:hypothetical protein